jgi:hypothetical protein
MNPALQLLAAILAGWLSDRQQRAIEYLREENRVLREQLGGGRLRLSDDQRRRLAVRGEALGRGLLAEVCTNVTPDYHLERNHQGIGNHLIDGQAEPEPVPIERIRCRDRLGGLLRSYRRAA